MSELLETKVVLINDKVKFSGKAYLQSGIAKLNPEVIIDYTPPIGDGEGYTSLELLLMSLATCVSTSVISLLRKMRKEINGMTVNATGIRREVHPLSFEKINLEFILISSNLEEEDVQKAIKLSEETYCPVWDLLKKNVVIETSIIIKATKSFIN